MDSQNIPQSEPPRNNLPVVTAARIPKKKPVSRRGLNGLIHHLLASVSIVRNEMPDNVALNVFADELNHFTENLRREMKGGAQ